MSVAFCPVFAVAAPNSRLLGAGALAVSGGVFGWGACFGAGSAGDHQHGDQVRHEPLQRQRLLLLARQLAGGDAVGHQPRRRHEVRSSRATSSAARSAARSPRTRCSSSRDYQGGRQKTPPSRRVPHGRARMNGAAATSAACCRAPHRSSSAIRRPGSRSRTTRSRSAASARSRATCSRTRRSIRAPNVARPSATSATTTAARRPKETTNQFDVKIDWNASRDDKLFVRYSKQTHE